LRLQKLELVERPLNRINTPRIVGDRAVNVGNLFPDLLGNKDSAAGARHSQQPTQDRMHDLERPKIPPREGAHAARQCRADSHVAPLPDIGRQDQRN
jgi:hypothetical protein